MVITPHLLTGAAIASLPIGPSISLPLAFLSHFALDEIPHLGTGPFFEKYRKRIKYPAKQEIISGIIDLTCGIFLLGYIFHKNHQAIIFLGALSAILVDLIDNVPISNLLLKYRPFGWLRKMHLQVLHNDVNREQWYFGLASQLILITILLFVLF